MREMHQALSEPQGLQVEHNMLRIVRLLSKLEEVREGASTKDTSLLQELTDCRLRIQSFLAECSTHMACLHEKNRNWEAAIRERLAAISFEHWNSNHYLQYAHSSLQLYQLNVSKDAEYNMAQVSPDNAVALASQLLRIKYAAQVASEDPNLRESTDALQSFSERMYGDMKLAGLIRSTNQEMEVTLEQAMQELEEMIGLNEVKGKIKDVSNWVEFSRLRKENGFKQEAVSLHMVFSGNPGTGKTTVARTLGRILKSLGVLKRGHVVEVDRSELVAEYVGQTAVKTMKKITEAKDGILFIDEAYSLTRSVQQDFGVEAVDTLVKEMEDRRNNLVVILAGYPAEMKQFLKSNPGLHSRFNNQIEFVDYTLQEMVSIMDYMLVKRQFQLTDDARVEVKRGIQNEIALHPSTHGNARLVRNLIEQMIMKKASAVVESGRDNVNLDLIDVVIVRAALAGLTGRPSIHQTRGLRDGAIVVSKDESVR